MLGEQVPALQGTERKESARRQFRLDLLQFVRPVLHGHRADDGAEPRQCKISEGQFRDIGQLHHYDVVRAQPRCVQRGGQAVDPRPGFGPGQAQGIAARNVRPVGRIDERGTFRAFGHRTVQQGIERLPPPPSSLGVFVDQGLRCCLQGVLALFDQATMVLTLAKASWTMDAGAFST